MTKPLSERIFEESQNCLWKLLRLILDPEALPAFRKRFLEALGDQCWPNRSTSPEKLHERWIKSYLSMGWVYGAEYSLECKTHPDLVPYEKLDKSKCQKDEAFCEVARQWFALFHETGWPAKKSLEADPK